MRLTMERETWKGGRLLPLISVIVCTLDRPASLRRTIESLIAQDLPPGDFEVIVVSNRGPALEATGREPANGPAIHYTFEPRLGLSNARNRGLSLATGELVAFIDDDATADPHWLPSLAKALDRDAGNPACAGGKVIAEWERPPPGWLRGSLLKFLGIVDLGERRRAVIWPNEVLVGCNIAFRTMELRDMGGFDPVLGRRGTALYGNEEVALEQRVHEAGGAIIYEPAAVVRHHVPAHRMSLAWFVKRVFYQGVTDYVYSGRYRLSARESPERGRLVALVSHRFRSGLEGGGKPLEALLALPYLAGILTGTVKGRRS
jgi:glycosyltransferase involved in cell wall biosynthesis